jgi:outer membrane lipoprotein carrier protein
MKLITAPLAALLSLLSPAPSATAPAAPAPAATAAAVATAAPAPDVTAERAAAPAPAAVLEETRLATATPAAPAPAAAAAPADARLDGVIDTIQKTYEGTTSFSGKFTQRFTYTMLRRTQESSGTVSFEKPGRMRWDYAAPSPKSFIVDGKSLWVVQPEDKVAFVNACFQQDGLTASVAFLWGEGKLREQFTISWFDGTFGDKTDHHLLLLPRDNNSIFARLILVVDPKTSRVKQSVVVDPAGNVNQFVFTDLVFNKGHKAGTFAYKPTGGINATRMPGSCDAPVPGL